MPSDLLDKVAIITGATSGIGRDTAILFAQSGAKVVLAGRREREGEEVVRTILASGGEALFIKTDVAKSADVKALVEKTVERFGRLDLAFNNAGVEGNWIPIAEQSEEDWDYTMDINVKGVWLCLKYEIQQMQKQGTGGAIVNMSSVAGTIGAAGAATYCASKHAVLGLTKSAALETARHGIRVNSICPGIIETPMGDRIFGAPEVTKWALTFYPLGRFGKPMEVAETVLFMCSDSSSFMTGQSIVLDGGFLTGPVAPARW